MNNSNFLRHSHAIQSESYMAYLEITVNTLIMVFAVFGNLLIILSIVKNKRIRNTFSNVLVLNVAFSDIILVLSSIPTDMAIEDLGYFPFGSVGCKLINPLSTYSINVMAMLLVFIAIERFLAIVFSVSPTSWKKTKISALIATHVIAIGTIIRYSRMSVLMNETGTPYCKESWSHTSSRAYTVFLFLIQFAIPLPIIVLLYCMSWRVIQKNNKETIRVMSKLLQNESNRSSQEEKKQFRKSRFSVFFHRKSETYLNASSIARHKQTMQTLKMFTAVVVIFAICMMPNQITWFYMSFRPSPLNLIVEKFFYWLTYSNAVLNPWIYAGFNPHFKNAYKATIKRFITNCSKYCKKSFSESSSPHDSPSTTVQDDVLLSGSCSSPLPNRQHLSIFTYTESTNQIQDCVTESAEYTSVDDIDKFKYSVSFEKVCSNGVEISRSFFDIFVQANETDC
ncbi:putative neuropeptide Y receptor type 6 [Hydractinia symbiolongicarpus]|uniref:putative neuropeptide Y receptor type 6 n=1 Tax=Hydractinia symbiolongicarpus TaxID=13093 RepID=UPI002549D8A9|nr:putative neuropeptide Y receptor type 6 [Hydractinia symbiolongicarpus]